MSYDNTMAMMEFTEVLKNEPQKAYEFIECNTDRFTKDGVTDILKQVLYSIKYHTDCRFYGDLYTNILEDVQIELDEQYDEEYEKECSEFLDIVYINDVKYYKAK